MSSGPSSRAPLQPGPPDQASRRRAPEEPVEDSLGEVREPPRAEALPGELKPLRWMPGRGPITDDEALGVLRRRRRVELAGNPKNAGRRSGVPDALPEPGGPKKASVFRFPARAVARAHARAELEGIPLTTVLEELLRDYADGVPERPDAVQERLESKGIRWQRR